jgi:hypothetical protein
MTRRAFRASTLLLTVLALGGCGGGGSGGDGEVTLALLLWNGVAIDASGLDHTPSDQGPPHEFGHHLGPCRAARAMSLVHIAMFEAVNAIHREATSLLGIPVADRKTSARVAIAQAAHDTLVHLYPSQSAIFARALAGELRTEPSAEARDLGVSLGIACAAASIQFGSGDGSEHAEPRIGIEYIPSPMPGFWRQDPISGHPLALGAFWPQVKCMVMSAGDQFRCPPPPALTDAAYTMAYDEVKSLGGDGVVTPTVRTPEQTAIGIYWAYDGTPSLCAPPRLYNQLIVHIARQQGTRGPALARLLALANIAMSEAAIGIWDSKYHYAYWRPVAGIRESDPGTGPTGLGDGNPATIGDPTFSPLGAPASNLSGPNFTPPFPAYPSGHAGFGGALFQTLRRFYGTDDIAFTFVSDELNGVTRDNLGNVRPLLPRSFPNLSAAEFENGLSRIYLGIHWIFDATEGIILGNNVANYVFDHILQPLP